MEQQRFHVPLQIFSVYEVTPFNDVGIFFAEDIQRLVGFVTRRFDLYRM